MNQEIILFVIATILYVVMIAVILVFVYKRFLTDDDVFEDVELGPMPQRRTQHTVWVHRAICISLQEKRSICHEAE